MGPRNETGGGCWSQRAEDPVERRRVEGGGLAAGAEEEVVEVADEGQEVLEDEGSGGRFTGVCCANL